MAAAEAKAQMNPIIAYRQTFLATGRSRDDGMGLGQVRARSDHQRTILSVLGVSAVRDSVASAGAYLALPESVTATLAT